MTELIEQAARQLADSKYAIALTGAGISTESGISDFRGPSGIWTKNPEAEKAAYLSFEAFMEDPRQWWRQNLSKPERSLFGDLDIVLPNPGHYALAELEELGVLKCVITQNIDSLHEKSGTKYLLEYHGNFRKLRCIGCNSRFERDEFDFDRLLQEDRLPPRCPDCGQLIKTDIVAFGEPIPGDVAGQSLVEAGKCDLMLICGTSAVVYPFANLPRLAAQKIPPVTIIEINAEATPLTEDGISDYLIQGQTGQILPQIVETVKKLRQELPNP